MAAEMNIVAAVTAAAIIWQSLDRLLRRDHMTVGAGQLGVGTAQRKTGLRFMVKFGFPVRTAVTVTTALAPRSIVNIVCLVTADAGHRCVRVGLIAVAGSTAGVSVNSLQRKFSGVVIKAGFQPAAGFMTGIAFTAQGAIVCIIFLVATDTGARSLPEYRAFIVAGTAGLFGVGVNERKIGDVMIEQVRN
jgi:hypothetical protein